MKSRVHFYCPLDTWGELTRKDDTSAMSIMDDRLQAEGRIIHSYQIITPKGRVKWLRDTIIAIRDRTGSIARVISSTEELTQFYQLKQQLDHIAHHVNLLMYQTFIMGRNF